MGQKVIPTGFRLGIIEDHRSRWYAKKRDFGRLLVEDQKIRNYLKKAKDKNKRFKYKHAGIPKIEIERKGDELFIILHAARPGVLIGKKGQAVDQLKAELEALTRRKVNLNILEVQRPELDANLIAESIAEQLSKRASFRRVMKKAIEQVMQAGAKGCKAQVSGRLGGSDMARSVHSHLGSIPLHTLRAKIDYGFTEAPTTYGHIGVKVWVYTGEVFKEDTRHAHAQAGQAQKTAAR